MKLKLSLIILEDVYDEVKRGGSAMVWVHTTVDLMSSVTIELTEEQKEIFLHPVLHDPIIGYFASNKIKAEDHQDHLEDFFFDEVLSKFPEMGTYIGLQGIAPDPPDTNFPLMTLKQLLEIYLESSRAHPELRSPHFLGGWSITIDRS